MSYDTSIGSKVNLAGQHHQKNFNATEQNQIENIGGQAFFSGILFVLYVSMQTYIGC